MTRDLKSTYLGVVGSNGKLVAFLITMREIIEYIVQTVSILNHFSLTLKYSGMIHRPSKVIS